MTKKEFIEQEARWLVKALRSNTELTEANQNEMINKVMRIWYASEFNKSPDVFKFSRSPEEESRKIQKALNSRKPLQNTRGNDDSKAKKRI